MYHSISDNPRDPHATSVTDFHLQMAELASRRCSVVPLPQAVGDLRRWKRLANTVALTFDDAYEDFLLNAAPVLLRCGFPATLFIPTDLLGGTAVWDTFDKSKRLMDWDGVLEAHRLGFGIGSHTRSHARLTECDAAALESELRGSLDSIRGRLPNSVPLLSYPGGYATSREMKAAKQAGYVGALGVASRLPNFPWTNVYGLRRSRWK
jgi:peptidoglycan/xylan/chitin deacetylase (PgdA/CDA1 family)